MSILRAGTVVVDEEVGSDEDVGGCYLNAKPTFIALADHCLDDTISLTQLVDQRILRETRNVSAHYGGCCLKAGEVIAPGVNDDDFDIEHDPRAMEVARYVVLKDYETQSWSTVDELVVLGIVRPAKVVFSWGGRLQPSHLPSEFA